MSDDKTKMPPRDPSDNGHDDAGHDAVSAAYRRAAGEEPPAHLDAAVLAMAHREVNGIHVATPRPRWFVPVAVAATVVVAVSLGLQVSRTPHKSIATISGDDSFSPAADEAMVALPDNGAADVDQAASDDAARSFRAQAPEVTASPPLSEDQVARLRMHARLVSPEEMQALKGERRDAEPAAEIAAQAMAYSGQLRAIDAAVDEAVTRARDEAREPDEWMEIIKALNTAGDSRRARIEWLAFRAVYPDEPLPPEFPEFE